MYLSEVFSQIATLDSASIDLDTNGDGVIVSANYTKVINAINLGLTDLYKEFPAKEKMLVVQLYAHITDYLLTRDFAETNTASSEPYKYIMDTTFDPFQEDILTILTVSNEGGEEYPLNEANQLYSLYTPVFNMIQHPFPDNENAIFITYKANHPKIPVDAVPATYNVELAPALLPLLVVYVNHKLLAPMNKEESMLKFQEYNALVLKTKSVGTMLKESSSNEKLELNDWV
jgi:hypothetical protein